MQPLLPGLHHITAIAGDPQRNVDFYTGVLGLRLVKITINYDDPGSYHFYYGDEAGSPGSILTFFAWPGGYAGARGTAQATDDLVLGARRQPGRMAEALRRIRSATRRRSARWDEEALTFYDPDGLQLELVAHLGAEERAAWSEGPFPLEFATRGFHSVTLSLRDRSARPTADGDDGLSSSCGRKGDRARVCRRESRARPDRGHSHAARVRRAAWGGQRAPCRVEDADRRTAAGVAGDCC